MAYTDLNNKLDWAMSFQRTGKFPLDRSSMFSSEADALAYAKQDGTDERELGGTSYVGQLICVDDGVNVAAYIIEKVGAEAKLEKLESASHAAGGVAALEQKLADHVKLYEALKKKVDDFVDITYPADKQVLEAKDAELLEKITAEQSRAEGVEGQLRTDLTAETNRAKKAEEKLTTDLATEVKRSTERDTALETRIGTEETEARKQEGLLDAAIKKEVVDRQGEVTRVEGLVTAEVDRAKAAEKVLTDNLAKEVQDRTNADTAINEKIKTIESKISNATHFVGISTTDPSLPAGATIAGHEGAYKDGDICLFAKPDAGNVEYIYSNGKWEEFGDQGTHATKAALVEEEKQRKAEDAKLDQKITSEVQKLNSKDSEQDGKISALETNVGVAADKASATGSLHARLKQEIADRQALETKHTSELDAAKKELKSSIDAMDAAYKGADTKLGQRIDAVNTTIGSKADASTFNTVYGAINKAKEDAEAANGALKTEITSAYGAADTALEGKITKAYQAKDVELNAAIEGVKTTHTQDKTALEKSINDVKSDLTTETGKSVHEIGLGVTTTKATKQGNIAIIPTAASGLGLVKSSAANDSVSVGGDGVMTMNKLNASKLYQGAGDKIILDGGNAAE